MEVCGGGFIRMYGMGKFSWETNKAVSGKVVGLKIWGKDEKGKFLMKVKQGKSEKGTEDSIF